MANINPGRYTVQVTVTVFADSRHDAYRQIQRTLAADARRHGIVFVDAEDTKLEPFCSNAEAHDMSSAADLAVDDSNLCANCLALARAGKCPARTDDGPCTPFGTGGSTCEYCDRRIEAAHGS